MKIRTNEIDLSGEIKDLSQYLETTDRIILSAKFGDGKTYFLDKFTNDEKMKKEYLFYTIYPVNYSVAPNEDIFEYIKRDIVLQLNEKELLDKIDLETLIDTAFNFSDFESLVSFLLSFVPGGEFYNKVFKKFCDKKKEYDEKSHAAQEYLSSFSKFKGSIYENDGFTKLIKNALDWQKDDHVMNGPNWKKKKPVLIVEDLDRLDPKHLFRILNVLSAHIDDVSNPNTVTNKFGFNNIILVMDYDTTKHIFHHFYGQEASYEGYMSKFLSCQPFRHSIQQLFYRNVLLQIASELHIMTIIDGLTNFIKKLSQLSVRDLKKLTLFDTKERMKRENCHINQPQIFSTSLPIFDIIIYMAECGMTNDEIIEDLTKLPEYIVSLLSMDFRKEYHYEECTNDYLKKVIGKKIMSEYIELMFPIYNELYGENNMGCDNEDNDEKYYKVLEDCDFSIDKNSVVTGIIVKKGKDMEVFFSIINKISIENTIKKFLMFFSNGVNMGALRKKERAADSVKCIDLFYRGQEYQSMSLVEYREILHFNNDVLHLNNNDS